MPVHSDGSDGRGRQPTPEEQLDALRRAIVDDWLAHASGQADELALMRASLSWRVTAPLRVARHVQLRVRELGARRALRAAAARLRRR